jgi:hypothetical protein
MDERPQFVARRIAGEPTTEPSQPTQKGQRYPYTRYLEVLGTDAYGLRTVGHPQFFFESPCISPTIIANR